MRWECCLACFVQLQWWLLLCCRSGYDVRWYNRIVHVLYRWELLHWKLGFPNCLHLRWWLLLSGGGCDDMRWNCCVVCAVRSR